MPTVLRDGELSRAELAFADHTLVPVDLVFDPIQRSIALSEEQTDNFKAALGRMLDAPVRKKFHGLANTVFVF
ncbi:MAG TPA: hypothetical protein VE687_01010 [Stellaceae bacterium]|nr:hypothetical protein [Stellaceae bacterium]